MASRASRSSAHSVEEKQASPYPPGVQGVYPRLQDEDQASDSYEQSYSEREAYPAYPPLATGSPLDANKSLTITNLISSTLNDNDEAPQRDSQSDEGTLSDD